LVYHIIIIFCISQIYLPWFIYFSTIPNKPNYINGYRQNRCRNGPRYIKYIIIQWNCQNYQIPKRKIPLYYKSGKITTSIYHYIYNPFLNKIWNRLNIYISKSALIFPSLLSIKFIRFIIVLSIYGYLYIFLHISISYLIL
jgi:hypothetical protein